MVNSAEQVHASAQLPNNKFDVISIVQVLAVLNIAQNWIALDPLTSDKNKWKAR